MTKQQGKQSEKGLNVNVHYVSTSDEGKRLFRVFRRLLEVAGKDFADSENSINAEKQDMPPRVSLEKTLPGDDGGNHSDAKG